MDKIWQVLQSNDTKTLNLTTDFEELWDFAQQAGWVADKAQEYWTKEKNDADEVVIFRCVSVFLLMVVNGWQHKSIL